MISEAKAIQAQIDAIRHDAGQQTFPDQGGNRIYPMDISQRTIQNYLPFLQQLADVSETSEHDRSYALANLFNHVKHMIDYSGTDAEYAPPAYNTSRRDERHAVAGFYGTLANAEKCQSQLAMVSAVVWAARAAIETVTDATQKVDLIGHTLNFTKQSLHLTHHDPQHDIINPKTVLGLYFQADALLASHQFVAQQAYPIALCLQAYGLGHLDPFEANDGHTDEDQAVLHKANETTSRRIFNMASNLYYPVDPLPDDQALTLLSNLRINDPDIQADKRRTLYRIYDDRQDSLAILKTSQQYRSVNDENFIASRQAYEGLQTQPILQELTGRNIGYGDMYVDKSFDKAVSYNRLALSVLLHNQMLAYQATCQEPGRFKQYTEFLMHEYRPDNLYDDKDPLKHLYNDHRLIVYTVARAHNDAAAYGHRLKLKPVDFATFQPDDIDAIGRTLPGKAWLLASAHVARDALVAPTQMDAAAETRLGKVALAASRLMPPDQQTAYIADLWEHLGADAGLRREIVAELFQQGIEGFDGIAQKSINVPQGGDANCRQPNLLPK